MSYENYRAKIKTALENWDEKPLIELFDSLGLDTAKNRPSFEYNIYEKARDMLHVYSAESNKDKNFDDDVFFILKTIANEFYNELLSNLFKSCCDEVHKKVIDFAIEIYKESAKRKNIDLSFMDNKESFLISAQKYYDVLSIPYYDLYDTHRLPNNYYLPSVDKLFESYSMRHLILDEKRLKIAFENDWQEEFLDLLYIETIMVQEINQKIENFKASLPKNNDSIYTGKVACIS